MPWGDNPYLGKTYVYTYDRAGNRTSKKTYAYTTGTLGTATATQTLTYSTGAWGDQLAGTTYDAVGNPTTYNGFTMTWSGRQLKSMVKNGGQYSYSFTYNDEGIRTSKTSQGVKHTYMLEGSRIVGEQFGVHFLLYLYDESGAPIGLQHRTSSYAAGVFDTYYFEKNVFGDVIGVYTADGTKIGTYKYDAWGNCTRVVNTNATTAQKQIFNTYNPFRYRGYYYDVETQLYYLQSRYYDPATGRFISPDNSEVILATPDQLTDKNLYAYCDNNPVTRKDEDGDFWNYVIGGVVGGVIGGIIAGIQGGDVADVIVGVVSGTLSGLVAASGLGWIAQAGISAGINGISEFSNQTIDMIQNPEDNNGYNWAEIGGEFLRGGVTSAIGSGLGSLAGNHITKTSKISGKLYDKYLNKVFDAGLRKEVGKSSSALERQASKYLSQSNYYQNISRGVSSVIGSVVSFRHLAW